MLCHLRARKISCVDIVSNWLFFSTYEGIFEHTCRRKLAGLKLRKCADAEKEPLEWLGLLIR